MSLDNTNSNQSAAASPTALRPFRFIHTADIHLDSPLTSLALRNQELADIVANATRQVLVRIVDLCLSEQIDALLIAGDLYDGSQTSMKTARFLAAQMRRLDEADISVFIIRGNHDAESKITRELTLPGNVHVFTSKAQSVVFDVDSRKAHLSLPVVIHGASFSKPQAPDNLLPLYKHPTNNAINIGMMHTSLDGSPAHDLYAPCPLADLQSHGFEYWALGHIHKRAIHADSNCTIVMPGIPQGRDIGEAGSKTITIVTIDDERLVEVEERLLAVAQFELIDILLDDTPDWQSTIRLILSKLDEAASECHADHLVARIVLSGNTPLAWRLHRDADLLTEEIKSRLDDEHHQWLDKLVINCEAPVEALKNPGDGPQSELQVLMIEEINNSSNLLADAKETMSAMFKALPSELRSKFGKTDEELEKHIKLLALQGSKLVTARLQTEPEQDDQESP